MKKKLLKIIDSGYFIFKKIIPLKTYRYAVCGGSNLVLDTTLYFICFHFIFAKENLDLFILVLSPHIASLFFVFPITFFIGFLLNRFIVFPESKLSMKTQFLRYLTVGIIALLISYLSMKLLVDVFLFYPTPSRLLTIVITVLFSYIMQNKFSFKIESQTNKRIEIKNIIEL
ncbi:GtrA family protein [Psychroserpens sp. Hel_I_66]|uniref:GtrA family protein n=1 Tax=Psychroserpens sp. Hel_I_66 TaxID=1250004 RepID=UPI00064755FD|nr:GtrA family protein [Psychroserpens sp. Hel_I_66]